jgi:hypothetical protein
MVWPPERGPAVVIGLRCFEGTWELHRWHVPGKILIDGTRMNDEMRARQIDCHHKK